MLDKYVDNEDPAKVRKSLLTITLLTVFFANVQFTANELSILGLKIVVDPGRLVAFGRLASGLLLCVFLLRALPQIVKSSEELHKRRIDRHERIQRSKIAESWGFDVPSPPADGPDAEFLELKTDIGYLRQKLEATYSILAFWASFFAVLFLDYALPVAAGVVASFYPYSVSNMITCLTVR